MEWSKKQRGRVPPTNLCTRREWREGGKEGHKDKGVYGRKKRVDKKKEKGKQKAKKQVDW